MATSGTTGFSLDLTDIVEESFERVGEEMRSGYDYRTARRSLDLLMSNGRTRDLICGRSKKPINYWLPDRVPTLSVVTDWILSKDC